jgi:hypothetical protein
MTIDVNLLRFDEDFFENLDEIIEDTMIQIFITHPKESDEITKTKEIAAKYESIFYSVPLSLHAQADVNCVAFSVQGDEDLALLPNLEKPIFIDESYLDESIIISRLSGCRGVLLNATREYPQLSGFYFAMGVKNVSSFSSEALGAMSMDQIVLQSCYPDYPFEEVTDAVKVISDTMFRPDQSIIARATKSSLELFGFR